MKLKLILLWQLLLLSNNFNNHTIVMGTDSPTDLPTESPIFPTEKPSEHPTERPTLIPTISPSRCPTEQPSEQPTLKPTMLPTVYPSMSPTTITPTVIPSVVPTLGPTIIPTIVPSIVPTMLPSCDPTIVPSMTPSTLPSVMPSIVPSIVPSMTPSTLPSVMPSIVPSIIPSVVPSIIPSLTPTIHPTVHPSAVPSMCPTSRPSTKPSGSPSGQPSRQPSHQPSGQPTSQPSVQPSCQPKSRPSSSPTRQPTAQPSRQPTSQPSFQPSCQPRSRPSSSPTRQPTAQPSRQPSCRPSAQPSRQPFGRPSCIPTVQPSSQPSSQPIGRPTMQPSIQPATRPSTQPSCQPISQPTNQPTVQPSRQPSVQPSRQPTCQPSSQPTCLPLSAPSFQPFGRPSNQPSNQPSSRPSQQPSRQPSAQPTRQPVSHPSMQPSLQPSTRPSLQPFSRPSGKPSTQPTRQPTAQPFSVPSSLPSAQPAMMPSARPSTQPTSQPSLQPASRPSSRPSIQPSDSPTHQPSVQPSRVPTQQPAARPSSGPVSVPTCQPSCQPSVQPSKQPSSQPSRQPTGQPSGQPSAQPSTQPSIQPISSPSCQPSSQPASHPSCQPSHQPSGQPTRQPTRQPSAQPSSQPSSQPSCQPRGMPSGKPSNQPSACPSLKPFNMPSAQPSGQPSCLPSSQPTNTPSCQPTVQPMSFPTSVPSRQPSSSPSTQPTCQPTRQPSCQPSSQPSVQPTRSPSQQPSAIPSVQPTTQPSSYPTHQPSTLPSVQPSSQPSTQPTTCPSQQPSSQPTAQPNSRPSSQPSKQPTVQPSSQPSIQPSCQPSLQPISQPTVQPSTQPTTSPSRQPTGQPSRAPSSQPTCTPSMQPSMTPTTQPTSQPTTEGSVRVFDCIDDMPCESGSGFDCAFFTGNIIFNCMNESIPCFINAVNFTVGPHTNLTVNGTCELIVNAQKYVTIHSNTTIKAPAVNFTGDSVHISGLIETSGLGPLYGASFSDANVQLGQGGSYGGSGGRNICNQTYFTGTEQQLGAIDILPDLYEPYNFNSPTMGSGGGVLGAGRGGGRIILSAANQVYVSPNSMLNADGTEASIERYGAGSGGSITIRAGLYNSHGILSVKGGISRNAVGGAGGGGRISIFLLQETVQSSAWNTTSFQIFGGYSPIDGNNGLPLNPCLSGGAGTLFIRNGFQLYDVTSLSVYNANITTYATTFITALPSTVTLIEAFDHAVLAGHSNITMPLKSTCTTSDSQQQAGGTGLCSYIDLRNASIVSVANTSTVSYEVDGKPFVQLNNTKYHGGPVNSSIFLISANVIVLHQASIQGLSALSSFGIQAQTMLLMEDSSILFGDQLVIDILENAEFMGYIRQVSPAAQIIVGSSLAVPYYYFYSVMLVQVGRNLTVSSIVATNLGIRANNLILKNGGSIVPPSNLVSGCLSNLDSSDLSCSTNTQATAMMYNNTYAITANVSITLFDDAVIQASAVLVCAPFVNIKAGASVNSDYRGCGTSQGTGAPHGGFPATVGGGGGGFGGIGGTGLGTTLNSGAAYSVNKMMFSGSGGSCCNGTCPINSVTSKGGGIVSVVARVELILNGNITSNGMYGELNDGGGSGGTVSINAKSLSGGGIILASGGAGGAGPYAGGGGGGGYIQIYNHEQSYAQAYSTFAGEYNAPGGQGGVTTTAPMVESEREGVALTFFDNVFNMVSISGTTGNNLRRLAATAATAGAVGAYDLPICPPGHGNSQATGQMCIVCPIGTYGYGNNSLPCQDCKNAPTHSTYTTDDWPDADCPFECDKGRTTLDCFTPFQNFIYHDLTLTGLGLTIGGFFVLVIAPLLFYRLRDKYGWFENKQMDVLGDIFKKANILDLGFGDDSVINTKRTVSTTHSSDGRLMLRNNPVYTGKNSNKGGIQDIQVKTMSARTLKDLRRVLRLADQDLPFHACRINFLGSNHPWKAQGGAWTLPTCRPVCLRPMLLRKEYKEFAEDLNKSLAWHFNGIDMIFFYLVTCMVPPLSASVMNYIRKRRTAILLDKIANYDYSCFRCIKQRLARNSLRVGISPDSTIAFIDFLFDEDTFRPQMKPLCPIGQTRLPATFKLAGLGTYFSPYFVDTNDMILQAVPQTDVASSFIDEAWISFICELNTKLRTVQSDALHLGIMKLIHFLRDEKNTSKLGGLVVEFCTFSNVSQSFVSDLEAEQDEALDAFARQQDSELDPSVPPPPMDQGASSPAKSSDSRKKSGTKRVSDTVYDRDSFVAATRQRRKSFERHSESGNWFSQLGDVLNIRGNNPVIPSGRGNTQDNRHASVEGMEMKDVSLIRPSELPAIDSRPSNTIKSTNVTPKGTKQTVGATSPRKVGESKCSWIYSALKYVYELISSCVIFAGKVVFKSSFSPDEDPNGYTLSFNEMCNAVKDGHLKLGILVTHPKVQSNTYIVCDDDYQSEDDDEANYSFDERPSNMDVGGGGDRKSVADEDNDDDDDDTSTTRGSNVQDFLRSPLASRESSHSIEKAYGHKADEMAKFYKIMLAAEVSMSTTAPQVSTTRPLFSRGANSNRGSFSAHTPTGSFSEKRGSMKDESPIKSSTVTPVQTRLKGREGTKSIERSGSRGMLSAVDISSKSEKQQQQYVDFRSVSSSRKPSSAEPKDAEYVEFGKNRGSGGMDLTGDNLRGSAGRGSSNSLEDDDEDEEKRSDEDDEEVQQHPLDTRDSNMKGRPTSSSISSSKRSTTVASKAESLRATQSARSRSESKTRTKSVSSTAALSIRSDSISKTQKLTVNKPQIVLKSLRRKTLKRTGGRRNFAKLHNLAPSAYQHHVNCWHWRVDDVEPVSDQVSARVIPNAIVISPKTPPAAIAKSALKKDSRIKGVKRGGGVSIGEVTKIENPALATPDRAEKKKFRTANVDQRDSFVFEIEEPEDFRHTMSRESNYFKDSDMHYTANMMRNTMYNNSRNSITAAEDDKPSRSSLSNARSSITGKIINRPPVTPKKPPMSSTTSIELNVIDKKNKKNNNSTPPASSSSSSSKNNVSKKKNVTTTPDHTLDLEAPRGSTGEDSTTTAAAWKLSQQPATQIKKGFHYAYMNKLFLFYLSRFLFGSNMPPIGPSYVRKILEPVFLILCISDLALIAMILAISYCLSDNITQCSDHLAFDLMVSVFPGALIFAPITGLVAMLLGPSGTLSRIYALSSRLAGINNVVIVFYFVRYYGFFQASLAGIYPIILLTSSRAFQCFFIDLYIAHVEKLRYTRGWDGLHTSLYKTKDNKKELVL